MSGSQQNAYSMTMSMSPLPPADLGSYARTMHQHTKRQMEAIAQSSSSPPRSSNDSASHQQHGHTPTPTGLPDGYQPTNRSRNSSECSYQG